MDEQYWDCDKCGERYPRTTDYPAHEVGIANPLVLCGGCASEHAGHRRSWQSFYSLAHLKDGRTRREWRARGQDL
jgi:hypothetical protein